MLPQKVVCLRREIGAHLEDLPGYANLCVGDLLAHADELDKKIEEYDRAIAKAAREDARSKRLMKLPGIGPVTASALLASMGSGHDFDNGRQVAAWIGLVPGNTAAAARRGWGASPRPEMVTCAACWSWARGRCSTASATSRIASAAGRGRWKNGAATGAR